ncbi:MAG: DUF2254 family protein [Acidimicrobiales bacterium]
MSAGRRRRRARVAWGRLRESFFALPLGFVALAAVGAHLLVQLDERFERENAPFVFTGGPDSARAVLSVIASSMLSFTGLVFSITIVALQLTSSQFSPRAVRGFLRDWITQLSLGVFVATFVFALTALRAVRGEDGVVDRFVPGVTISVAFVLVAASVLMFVEYIHHMAQSIRVVTIIARIAEETREAIDERAPADSGAASQGAPPEPPAELVDDEGRLRVVLNVRGWDELAPLAFDEIRHWGAGSARVHRRLRRALCDLLEVCGPSRRAALEAQLRLLDARLADLAPSERALALDLRRGR